mgnify:CR=1 FL=1|tara:strand:+ start:282 stop:743 length:462 start_codon:yes stop_codon:yes gene_type:complete
MFFFILINFLVSFLSDIILNDLANKKIMDTGFKIIYSLKPYFQDKSIIISGIYAGLTVIVSLAFVMILSKIILGFYEPTNSYTLLQFLFLSFVIGYFIDILIEKLDIFGKPLHPYYKEAGSGFWGAVAFIFSIVISFYIKYGFCKLNKHKLIC